MLDDDEVGVHGNSKDLGTQWLKSARRCCFGFVVCTLCCMGVLFFFVVIPCLKIVVLALHFNYACFVCLMERTCKHVHHFLLNF
jgi:hypothetical protein